MGWGDGKSTNADQIASCAEDLQAVLRVVGDGATVLLVLGVSEENSALDLVAYVAVQITDSSGSKSCTLAVNWSVSFEYVIERCFSQWQLTSIHQLQQCCWGT